MSSKTKPTATKENGKPALVPELRFPEFREAAGWPQMRLIDTADRSVKWSFIGGPFGSNLKSSDYVPDGVRIIQLQNIGDGEFFNEYQIFTTPQKADELLSNNIYPGEIIMSKMGDPVGRACLIPDAHDRYVMCSDGIRLVVDEKQNEKYFIYSLINSPLFRAVVEKTATGSTRKRIGLDELKSLPMWLPKKPEQQKIAECLSSVDELIAAQARKLDALKTHKKGLMQQLFPREGETQPRLRLPEFQNAGDWDVDAFDKIIDLVDGDRGTNYPKSEEFSQSGYCLFLSAKNVTKTGFKFEETQFITKEKDDALRKGKLKRKDVVLTTRGTIGQFAYYSEEIPHENIRINSGMVILRLRAKKIIPDYLYIFTNSEVLRSYIKKTAFGNAQQQLTVGEIKKFQLYYPGPAEQQRIADCLSSLDDLVAAQIQTLEALRTHKQGLMQQLFPSPVEANA